MNNNAINTPLDNSVTKDLINPVNTPVIKIESLYNRFGTLSVHEDLNLDVTKGEMIALVGGSGSGKTTLLKTIIMLQAPTSGQVYLFGQPLWGKNSSQSHLRKRFGMLFQGAALFSSLTVMENIIVPLKEYFDLPMLEMVKLAELKIALAGLPAEAAHKYPRQLSGGMLKRAGLARALALDPELLFLDEPTAGLDPVSASAFDELMVQLKTSLGLTIVMVTHDLDSLWATTDRVAFLGDKHLIAYEPMRDLMKNSHPLIQHYFEGPRGRAAGASHGK